MGVAMDLVADVVLFAVDLRALLLVQVAAVCRSIVADLLMDTRLIVFDTARLLVRQLTRAHAVRDPLLLNVLPLTHPGHRHRLRTPMIVRGLLHAAGPHRLLMRYLVLCW